MIEFPKYSEFLNAVIDWNTAAGNGPAKKFGEIQIIKQFDYTKSEIQETIDAIRDTDRKEFVDGVCDVFVTGAYLAHLQGDVVSDARPSNVNDFSMQQIHLPKIEHEVLPILMMLHSDCVSMNEITHEKIQLLILSLVSIYRIEFNIKEAIERVESFMQAVIDSNNSKFIPFDDFAEFHDEHMEFVTEKYRGQFKDITPVQTKLGDKDVIVMRADGGEGKILKPMTFKEPMFELSFLY